MTSRSERHRTTWRKLEGGAANGFSGCRRGALSTKLSTPLTPPSGWRPPDAREQVCACVLMGGVGFQKRRSVKLHEGKEKIKWDAGCQDGDEICFPSCSPAGQPPPQPAFVLQSSESPRFNACRLTMHCYYTVFMFPSCVIWPKESLQSERLMQNLCLYGCFSQWKNQYCRLDAQKWLSALWLTLKALGDWELHLLFKESSVVELS